MRTRNFILIGTIATLGFISCEKESASAEDLAKMAFSAEYGNQAATWSTKSGYQVASFDDDQGNTTTVWYNGDNKQMETEDMYDKDDNSTPTGLQAIVDAVRATYPETEWEIEEIEKISRKGMETVYEVEIENLTTDKEIELLYSESGKLLRTEEDDNNDDSDDNDDNDDNDDSDDDSDIDDNEYLLPETLPTEVSDYINANYPNTSISDIDIESDEIEVEIDQNGKEIELEFEKVNGVWVLEGSDIEEILPTELIAKIEATYPGAVIVDYETEDDDNVNTVKEVEIIKDGETEETELEVALVNGEWQITEESDDDDDDNDDDNDDDDDND